MRTASNNKDLIIINRTEYEEAIQDAFARGAASMLSNTKSAAKGEIETSQGTKKVRRAVLDDDRDNRDDNDGKAAE